MACNLQMLLCIEQKCHQIFAKGDNLGPLDGQTFYSDVLIEQDLLHSKLVTYRRTSIQFKTMGVHVL